MLVLLLSAFILLFFIFRNISTRSHPVEYWSIVTVQRIDVDVDVKVVRDMVLGGNSLILTSDASKYQ